MTDSITQAANAAVAADAKVKAAVDVKVSELQHLWDEVKAAGKVPGKELAKAHDNIVAAIGWLKAHL